MIHEIVRPDDPRLEPYRHVGDPGWLRERHLFVAEGRLVVARLLDMGHAIESVLVTPTALSALGATVAAACPIFVAPPSILEDVTGFHFHRGCVAIAPRLPARPLGDFADARLLVILEGVGNPDNVGGIFRAGAALGAGGVLLGPGTADPLYRKAVRTSMGAALRLPFAEIEDAWPETLHAIRRMGFTVAALSPSGRVSIDEFAASLVPAARVALLAGAEGPGLTPGAIASADVSVRIPVDSRSDSLNVVVAVGIALSRVNRPK